MYYNEPIPQNVQDHCTKHAPYCVGCPINCKAPTNDKDFPRFVEGVICAVDKIQEPHKIS